MRNGRAHCASPASAFTHRHYRPENAKWASHCPAGKTTVLSITKFNFLVPLGIFKHILFIAIFSFRSRPLVFTEPYLWQKDTIGHLTAKQTRWESYSIFKFHWKTNYFIISIIIFFAQFWLCWKDILFCSGLWIRSVWILTSWSNLSAILVSYQLFFIHEENVLCMGGGGG